MPPKPIQEQPNNNRGRPLGSRNKFPMLMRQLVLTAAEMSGKPTEKWIIEEALDEEGNQIWVEVTDKWGKTVYDKKNEGKPLLRKKMIRRKVLEWTGAGGSLGYMKFLAQEEREHFRPLLLLAQHQQENTRSVADEGLHIPTLEELREEWIRRGLRAIDFDRMNTVTGIQAKQRVKLIEHDPNERKRYGSAKQSAKQSGEATSATDPESEQWWPEEEDTEAED